jgi:hypothetical protein
LQRYFNHFSPEFLAIKGDWQNARHSAPYVGVILFPSLIFLIIGLFKANYKKSINLFFLLILILAPIPAALTRDTVQATRSMWMSIGLVYFIALGINIFLKRFSHLLIYFLLITIYLFSFIYYSDLYLNHMVKTNPSHFLYGYKEITKYLIENKDKYQNVYMTNYYKQPYIYYLFYSKYPPALYQKYSHLDSKSLDIGNIEKIDKIIFETPNLAEIKEKPNTLAIFSYNEIMNQLLDPTSFKQIGNFYIYENYLKIILILILALFSEVFTIASTPILLNPDEAALGYNAYSILQTGKDEHGQSFPLHLKSFGDYKPALYTYI